MKRGLWLNETGYLITDGRADNRCLGIKRSNLGIKHLIGLNLNGTQDKRACKSDKRCAR